MLVCHIRPVCHTLSAPWATYQAPLVPHTERLLGHTLSASWATNQAPLGPQTKRPLGHTLSASWATNQAPFGPHTKGPLGHTPSEPRSEAAQAARAAHTHLVDAALMREGVGAHDRLVWLDHHAAAVADQPAGRVNVDGTDARVQAAHLRVPAGAGAPMRAIKAGVGNVRDQGRGRVAASLLPGFRAQQGAGAGVHTDEHSEGMCMQGKGAGASVHAGCQSGCSCCNRAAKLTPLMRLGTHEGGGLRLHMDRLRSHASPRACTQCLHCSSCGSVSVHPCSSNAASLRQRPRLLSAERSRSSCIPFPATQPLMQLDDGQCHTLQEGLASF